VQQQEMPLGGTIVIKVLPSKLLAAVQAEGQKAPMDVRLLTALLQEVRKLNKRLEQVPCLSDE